MTIVASSLEQASMENPPERAGPETAKLGQRLKDLRQRRRFSLRQLADRTGTSASFISQLERD